MGGDEQGGEGFGEDGESLEIRSEVLRASDSFERSEGTPQDGREASEEEAGVFTFRALAVSKRRT